MIFSLLAFLVLAIFSYGMTLWIIRRATHRWAMDNPDVARKQHRTPVPRLGGIPLFCGFLVLWLGIGWLGERPPDLDWWAVLAGSAWFFGVGLVDDFRPLGAKLKLLGQMVGAVLVYLLGMNISAITYPVGGFSLGVASLSLVLTVFWLIAVPNLINLIDGADGLAAGLGLFLLATVGYLGWLGGRADVALAAFGVAGALLGFLCFNFPPARIFLGDGGAYFLGFLVAVLSLKSEQKGSVAGVLFVVVIALGLPIMDTVLALIRRAIRGFPLFRADADHIHHRLRRVGVSDRRLVLGMYLVSVVFALLGLSVLWSQGRTLPIVLGLVFFMAVVGIRVLGYAWNWTELMRQFMQAFERRTEVRYALLQTELLNMELERFEDAEAFAARMLDAMEKSGLDVEVTGDGADTEIDLGGIQFGVRFPEVAKEQGANHWLRLTDCFGDVGKRAVRKWGTDFPAALASLIS
jgi:UDP-GlcNAc:undecaprenyl-phosphate GlcNAc-1-phosphate transferase